MRARGVAVLVLMLSACSRAAAAEAVVQLPAPGTDTWEPLSLPRVERHTVYTPVMLDGSAAIRSDSRCAASALVVPLAGIDLERTPVLRWRWQVERGLAIENERAKAGDDFAARVYILFRFEPDRASWRERLRHRLGETLYRRAIPGNALNYVWASSEPAGARWPNPFADASRMLSLGRGPLPEWRSESVDVVADYRREFDADPPPALGLAIMTDSDNTCSEAAALFADFRFAPREAGP